MGEAGEAGGGPGLAVRATPRVRGVLERAAGAPGLDGALRARARAAAEAEAVPWALVDACCTGLREAGGAGGAGPYLHEALEGAEMVLPRAAKKPRDPGLDRKLREVRERLEEKRYRAMVKDVAAPEPAPAFSSFREQLAFGLNTAVVIFALAAAFFTAAKGMAWGPQTQLAASLVGGTLGMVVETLLFIIRTNRPEKKRRAAGAPPGRVPRAKKDA